jgi:hypothetical protein
MLKKKRSIGMKVVGVLLLLTGLTVTLILRFSPVMGSNSVRGENRGQYGKLNEEVAPVQWAPAIGSILIVAGTAIVVAGRRKKSARQMPDPIAKHRRPKLRHEPNGREIKGLHINHASGILYARKNSLH